MKPTKLNATYLALALTLIALRPAIAAEGPTTAPRGAAAGAGSRVALVRLDPSPDDPDEVKAALTALDAELERLARHADSLPAGEVKRDLEKRLPALRERRDGLALEFTRPGWDSLIQDLKREWDQVIL